MSTWEMVWQDLKFSWRTLSKTPTFTITILTILTAGIGSNTLMFSVIRGVLLKPLSFGDPSRLVRLALEDKSQPARDGAFSSVRLAQLVSDSRSFVAVGAFLKSPQTISFSDKNGPTSLVGARVSANFLQILEVKPLLGRGFLPDEDAEGAPPVAIISERLWKNNLLGDPQVVGKTVTFNALPCIVVGVLPSSFSFPFDGTDVWFPKPTETNAIPAQARLYVTILNGIARVKPSVSLEQVQSELKGLNAQYTIANPDNLDAGENMSMRAKPLKDFFVANVRASLWILFAAVGFVLLIVCANVASLLLTRAVSRSREFVIRTALGAAPARLLRQLLIESVGIALTGGILGILLAKIGLIIIEHSPSISLPRTGDLQLDFAVVVFDLVISVATGAAFGLIPASRALRLDLVTDLRERGGGVVQHSSNFGLRGFLVIGQISLSIVLLIGSVLLMKSFIVLTSIYPGFESTNVLSMKITIPALHYDTLSKKSDFFHEIARRVAELPKVRGAAIAMSLPSTKGWIGTNVLLEGQPADDGDKNSPTARLQAITHDYFQTLRIPLCRGREFVEQDDVMGAKPVVIINESFARRFWPSYPRGIDPIGQRIREGVDAAERLEIVGIVGDVRQGGPADDAEPEFYVPIVVHAPQSAYLVLRTEMDPTPLIGAVRAQILAVDKDQPVSDVRTMDNLLEATLGQRRFTTVLLGIFASVALVLAIIGIYGLVSYNVEQRTREFCVRQALGASRRHILQIVVNRGMTFAITGISIGIVGAFVMTRLIKSLLFHISTTDPATFLAVSAFFLLVALLATYVPARRILRINPIDALRSE
jgi:putative ABC transport system permease protein